jgi:hypothetical protein
MERTVQFAKYMREPEVMPVTDVDVTVIKAIQSIKENTPHQVTFELTKHDEGDDSFFNRKKLWRITTLTLKIKQPLEEMQ